MTQVSVLDYTSQGVDPTGTGDSTAGFMAAASDLAAEGGGVFYVPGGAYRLSAGIPWSGKPLLLRGDGEASVLLRASATPFRTFDIANVGGSVVVQDLLITNTVNANSYADDHAGLYFTNCQRPRLHNVHVNSSGDRVNKAVVFDNCDQASVVTCDLRGYVNAVLVKNGTAVVDITATGLFTNPGSGVATAGNLSVLDTSATIHATGVETNGGDHGIYASGPGSHPSFFFLNDFEVNNCHGNGVHLETGSQFWANQLWCSNQPIDDAEGAYCGIYAGPGYTGWLSVSQSVIQHFAGSGVSVLGGQSFWLSDTSFSGCCGHGSIYYDVYLAPAVKQVAIRGCNFDVEPFNSRVAARAAVNVSQGATAVRINGNQFASAAAYGLGKAVNDPGNAVTWGGGNIMPA